MSPTNDNSDTQVWSREDKLAHWHKEATEWASERTLALLGAQAKPATARDVMSWLDEQGGPAGYEIMRFDYSKRYHFVRRLLLALARQGKLSTSLTTNARRRTSVAFSWPRPVTPGPVTRRLAAGTSAPGDAPSLRPRTRRARASQYEVIVEGSPEIKERIEAFLEREKLYPDAVLITKVGSRE